MTSAMCKFRLLILFFLLTLFKKFVLFHNFILAVYTNGALYGILEKHPFTAFGENLALVLQSLVIAFLVWKYTGGKEKINTNNGVTLQERFMTAILYVSYITCTFTILPDNLRYLLISSNVPIMLYSRGTQVLETFRIQHTGAQSVVTTTMNLVGTLIRILTTIKEVGWDFAILIGFALSLILNLTMFIQYFYYRSNTERFISQLQVQAEKKEK